MTQDESREEVNQDQVTVAEADSSGRLDLKVDVRDIGPCKKHISVVVPAADIADLRSETVADLGREAVIPGFRAGRVPQGLLVKRFRKEIADQLKQKLLLQSLEQVSEDHDLDPINEPDLDVENLEVPESGDFEYEFEIEVRPVFELPEYNGITIRRPVREVAESDVTSARERFLAQFGQVTPHEGAAEAGDYVVANLKFTHNDNVIREFEEVSMRLRPTLRFWDAEIAGFDQLLIGSKEGDVRETEVSISREAADVEMRDEKVQVQISVLDVKRLQLPELDEATMDRIGVKSVEELDEYLKSSLERQVSHQQRQKTREQVLDKITESATWDLPEGLVRKHVDNALRREILEMQQAGFTRQQIQARESQIRQQSLSTTQQALKQHFVLDKIATKEEIECTDDDIATEIYYMAYQQGESPRKLRARLVKSGMIENLEAQIRERKAVDFLLSKASFEDEPMDDPFGDDVESVNRSITSNIQDSEVASPVEASDDAE